MNEEKYIEEKVGKRNPFVVPEGYFEGLTASVMQSIPERKPRAKSIWMRPVFYVAAAVCALFITLTIWFALPEEGAQQQTEMAEARQEQKDTFFEDAADYMMIDNEDIYVCLADY